MFLLRTDLHGAHTQSTCDALGAVRVDTRKTDSGLALRACSVGTHPWHALRARSCGMLVARTWCTHSGHMRATETQASGRISERSAAHAILNSTALGMKSVTLECTRITSAYQKCTRRTVAKRGYYKQFLAYSQPRLVRACQNPARSRWDRARVGRGPPGPRQRNRRRRADARPECERAPRVRVLRVRARPECTCPECMPGVQAPSACVPA